MENNFILVDEELMAKYLLGEATEAQTAAIEAWSKQSAANLRQLNDYKAILSASKLPVDQTLDERAALERLNARIGSAGLRKHGYFPVLRLVAILAVICSLSWFIYRNTIASRSDLYTSSQTLTRQLPDGSTVILNKQSSLSFVGGLFNRTRQVKLKGEAFFQVSKDRKKPFIIEVNDIRVTVVGTSFNVKNKGKETTVNVESGIVKVEHHRESVRLVAGQKVELKENRLIRGENLGKLYNYYYTHELICDQTPLRELIPILNEKFNAHIVIINPAIEQLPISTTFKNETLQEILEVVSKTLKIKVSYAKDLIKLQ